MDIHKEILKTIKYFSFFAYHPTGKEIYTFLQAKINRNSFNIELDRMVKQKIIENRGNYTVGEYSIISQKSKVKSQKLKSKVKSNNETMEQWSNLNNKRQISKRKLNSSKFKLFIKLLTLFPQIKLVGLSGSISMMNAGENDDIDLFIITAKNRLFTGRIIALFLAQLLGLRRSREARSSNNKICLNLFFDERNLKVPKFKQTEFVGHEVLQMKPLVNKDGVYERFLTANKWVFKLFPNASHVIPVPIRGQAPAGIQTKSTGSPTRSGMTESILKKFQLRLINKHKTTEIITFTQLWFHPNDFEKKIKH